MEYFKSETIERIPEGVRLTRIIKTDLKIKTLAKIFHMTTGAIHLGNVKKFLQKR